MIPIRALLIALLLLEARALWAVDPPAAPPPEIKIGPGDPPERNEFGNSVAIDGDWAVIGDQVDDFSSVTTGAAYVFRHSGSGWVQVAKLTSGAEDDAFGLSVDISGSTIVVGAWGDHEEGSFTKGAAYVFERARGADQWTLTAKLTAGDGLFGDQFGFSVAIHRNTIAVGAPLADAVGDFNTGAVYVFDRGVNDQWYQVQKLWPTDAERGSLFGESVAVSTCTVIAGAPSTDRPAFGSGAAYVFDRCTGAGWRQTARLNPGELDRFFGSAVALDRETAVVGANANYEHGTFTGAAYVFGQHAGGPNHWGQLASLSAFDPEPEKNFGWSVGIHGDTVVVGARGDSHTGPQAGAAYVFRRDVGGRDRFGPVKKLTASDSIFGFEDFGWSIDISDSAVLVGAPKGGALAFTGAAYLYPVPEREPVCRVAGEVAGDGVTLDFRLGATLPVDWSVWAWITGRPHLLWATPLGIIEPPIEVSVPLPGLRSLGRIWFLSMLSTSENGIVCADWDRVNTGRPPVDASAGDSVTS